MEFLGKRWQLRLLAGLLAIFVTLYFMSDLFGGIRADDGSTTIGETSELDEDTVDGEEDPAENEEEPSEDEEESEEDEEESEEEDEIMLLAAGESFDILDPDSPFVIDSIEVRLNRTDDANPGTLVDPSNPPDVWDGENFELTFTWHIEEGHYDNYAGASFYYDKLLEDLAGIAINNLQQSFDPLNPGQGSYSIDGGVLTINIGDQLDVYKYTGTLNVSGKIKLDETNADEDGKFTISFGKDYTLDLTAPSLRPGSPNLGVQKSASGEVYKDSNGNFYQDFTVTVYNWGTADATNVVLEDRHGSIFTDDPVDKLQLSPAKAYTLDTSGKYNKLLFTDPLKPNDSVTLTYRMKIADTSQFVNGHDNPSINSNNVIATSKEGAKAEGKASAKFEEPSIKKNGALSADGKKITWTITVEPGIFKNTTWFPDEPFTITDPMLPAGTSVTFTNKAFVDGKYVYTFESEAPEANTATDQTVDNTATVTVKKESKDAYAEVIIPASAPGTVDKSHDEDQVVLDENGDITIPWKVVSAIPDTELESVTLHDEIEESWNLNDTDNGVIRDTFKLTVNGKTYTIDSTAVEWLTYELVNGADKIGKIKLWSENYFLGYDIEFYDSALKDLRNQNVEITYDFFLSEPSVTSVTNDVRLTIKPKNEPSVSTSDSDIYIKPNVSIPFRAEKNRDDYSAGALSTSGRFPVGWRIDILDTDEHSFKAGEIITITDTLPNGYELIDGSESFLRTNGDNWPQTPVTYTPVHTISKKGDTFTIRITLNEELENELNGEGGGFSVLYITQMKESFYYAETAKKPHTLNIENRANIGFKGGTVSVSGNADVPINGEDLLNKTGKGQLNADNTGLTATYTIHVNQKADEINGGKALTVVDTLGSSLTVDKNSIVIQEYVNEPNQWASENWVWRDATGVSYSVSGQKITFKSLKDSTYYKITYGVTGTVLDRDDLTDPNYKDEMAEEIANRYDNTVSMNLSSGTTQSHGASLDSNSFRTKGAISYKFTITGTKRWPGGSNVKQIDLKLTQTEHVIDSLVPKLGQDIKTVRTYHLVTSNADLKTSTATDIYKKVTIDSNGSWLFTIDDLVVSDLKGSSYSYTIQEQDVPGYIPNYSFRPGGANEWDFQGLNGEDYVIRYQDNNSVEVLIQNAKTSSVIKPGNIYVKKSDSDDENHTPVAGATFSLKMTDPHNGGHDQTHTLAGVSIPDAKNVTHVSDTEITFITTDVPAFINNLPADHIYSLEETVPPIGFALGAKEAFTFGIRDSGSTYAISKNSTKYFFDLQGGADLDVRNEKLDVSSVTIKKTDGTTSLLSGAEITITGPTGTNLQAADLGVQVTGADTYSITSNTITFTTKGSGVNVTGLPEGTYTVSEKKAPSGYALTTDFTFKIDENAKVTATSPQNSNTFSNGTITLVDKLNELTVRKVGSDDPNTLLAGAKFTIARGSGNSSDLTAAPITVDGVKPADLKAASFTFTTKSTTETTIKGLPAGAYTLTEDEAPEGYEKPSTALSFTVGNDGSITGSGTAYTVANKKITVSDKKIITANIAVKKVDTDTNAALSGAQFTITAGKAIDWSKVTFGNTKGSGNNTSHSFTTGGSDTIAIKGLPVTTYTLTETTAPSGYALTTEFMFTVEEDGTVSAAAGNGSNTLGVNNTITLKDKLNKITLEKKDEDTGTLLSGAKFEIAAPANVDLTKAPIKVSGANSVKTEQNKLTFTTSSKAATITGLPVGTYTLTEAEAPASYGMSSNPSQTFTIKTDGTIDGITNNAFTVTNKMITADIAVKKVRSDVQDTILPGAEFTLSAIKHTVDWTRVTINGTPGIGTSALRSFVTTGDVLEIKGLPVGNYRLVETKAPNGFLSTEPFAFEVTGGGTITSLDARYDSANKMVTLIDQKPDPGTIEIIKTDRGGNMLPGAEFTLTRTDGTIDDPYETENIDNPSLSADRKTLTFTTTAKPARIKGLAKGNYEITETKAPSGYILSAAPENVTLNDDTGSVSSESISITNQTTEISINKIDMTSGEQLPSAELIIRGRNGEDFTNVSVSGAENDHVDQNSSTLTFTTTDRPATVKGLPEGDYELEERAAPDGYTVTTKFYFTIDENGNVLETANSDNGDNTLDETAKTITLKDNLTEISINKVDMTSQKQIPGAKLTISTVSGSLTNAPISITETGGANIPFNASVNELSFTTTDKTATIKGLPAGDYTLTETVAPDGYAITTEFYFTIDESGKVSETANANNGNNTLNETTKTITLNDELTEISINKVDMTNQKQLPNAVLTIRNDNGDSVEKADVENANSVTKNGSTLTFATTDKTAAIKGLPAGDYTLTETTAPDGYAKTTTTFRFTINPDGTVTAPTNTTTPATNEPGITLDKANKLITVENAPLASITIVKEYLEEGSNKKIAPTAALLGATSFGLFSDAQCNTQIGTAVSPDTNGEVTFSDLADGTYYVKEISSPSGYKQDDTVYKFDVLFGKVTCYDSAGGTVTVKPTYTNISTTPVSATDSSKSESNSSSEGSKTESSSAATEATPNSGSSENTAPTNTGSQPSGSQPSGSRPTGSRPSGGTKPTGTTAPTTVTTAPTTATTSARSTLTEPDEIEPEKTTKRTTAKTKRTKKTTAAPETDLPKTTTVGTERTDIAIGVNQVTREPGIGIDSNLTVDEENPNTAVPFTSLAAVFAAAGTLAVVTRKKKKK